MAWLIACLLTLLLTGHWLVACLLVVIYLYIQRRSGFLTEEPPSASAPLTLLTSQLSTHVLGERHSADLLILRVELGRLLAEGAIDRAFYDQVAEHIDALSEKILGSCEVTPNSLRWKRGRQAAWELLIRHHLIPPGPPPWRGAEHAQQRSTQVSRQQLPRPQVQTASSPKTDPFPTDSALVGPSPRPVHSREAVAVPPLAADSLALLYKAPAVPPGPASVRQATQTPTTLVPSFTAEAYAGVGNGALPSVFTTSPEDAEEYAWKPAAPHALERALQTVSGWPALIAPFLVQNIGWFVGGFCFVTGSIFLVSYTTGFTKALTISAVLLAYTLLLLWGGYQLRRRRPELATASSVLLTLGVLLVPLNLASAVRLIETGQQFPWLMIGVSAALLSVGGLSFATALVSGVMDRSLQGRHPQIYLALASLQLVVPLLGHLQVWPVLACLHLILLGLLAYGLILFTRDWLRSIFIERRKIAYYAAGTLVYAALVSFVHLSWSYGERQPLPQGYYSPFLMLLCGLLFYVDAELKQWTKRYTFLSRCSFAIYGLSVLALLLSADAPVARFLTLLLAIALYGMVVWQYLMLPPLYLLLAGLAWLYYVLILQHLPHHWYLLASLPGLGGLCMVSRWLRDKNSLAFTLVCARMWMGMAFALTGWSLFHAQPGLVAMGTAVVTMGMAFYGLQCAPPQLFGGSEGRTSVSALHNGPWLYLVTLLGGVAVAYAPPWTGLTWATQSALGLVLLAWLWSLLGLHWQRTATQVEAATIEVLLNSALLTLAGSGALAVMLALPGLTDTKGLPLLLVLMGGVLLWLSITLSARWLFYGVLGLWGTAGVIGKLMYGPGHHTGATEMLLVLVVWALVWWLEHEADEVKALRREQAQLRAVRQPVLTLLGHFPVSGPLLPRDLLHTPLRQTLALLWIAGVSHVVVRFLEGNLAWGWTLSTGLGALGALLGAGLFRFPSLLSLSIVLGLGSGLSLIWQLGITTPAGLCFAGAFYALLVWRLCLTALAHPAALQLAKVLHLGGSRARLEQWGHWTACVITLLCVVGALGYSDLFVPSVLLLLTLATSMAFLWLAGRRYRQPGHSYTVLGLGTLGALLCYTWSFPPRLFSAVAQWHELLADYGLGFTLVLLSLFFWGVAWQLTRRSDNTEAERVGFAHSLYRKPLRVMAALLALGAATQQLGLVWLAWTGTGYTLSVVPLGVLFLAGISLLLANHALDQPRFTLIGILCPVVAVLWAYGIWSHGPERFTPQLGDPAYSDQWLLLAALASGLALLVHKVNHRPHWERLYAQPLSLVAGLTYGWSLFAVLLLSAQTPVHAGAFLPWVWLTLTIGLFPLVRSMAQAAVVRGLGVPLLLSGVLISCLGTSGLQEWLSVAILLWGYALWSLGNFVLPRLNGRWRQWAVAPAAWPWLGLLAVVASLFAGGSEWQVGPWAEASRSGGYLIAVALYLLLLLRNSAWPGFPWLAVLTLTGAGLSFTVARLWPTSTVAAVSLPLMGVAASLGFVLGTLVWANALLLGVPVWRKYGQVLTIRMGWHRHDLSGPFLVWPSLLFHLWLLDLVLWNISTFLFPFSPSALSQWPAATLSGCALVLSFCHTALWQRSAWPIHALLASALCTFFAAWLGMGVHLFHLPFFLTLWSAVLWSVQTVWGKKQWGSHTTRGGRHPVKTWLDLSFLAALVALLLVPQVALAERLVTLAVLTGIAASLGWQRLERAWLLVALGLVLILLHGWWLLWVPVQQVMLLLPWYALQLAGLAWLLLWLHDTLRRDVDVRQEGHDQAPAHTAKLKEMCVLLSGAWPGVATLALLQWVLHGGSLLKDLAARGHPQWLTGNNDVAAAVLAAALLLALGIRQAWQTQQPVWVYGGVLFGGAVSVYLRLLVVGLAPASAWDTAALLGATYVLFIIQRFTLSAPLLQVVMILPLLTLFTVPLQLASSQVGAALLATGVLYLLTYRETNRPFAFYLTLLAFNAAVYVWVPGWANHYRMLQLYIVPLATSVLLLLHLHRQELKPSVLKSVRLAATSLLYISATVDVFLRADLAIFAIALALSLAGIIIGLALRTRAFLYSGVIFLVVNILGQLLLLFPEQRLGKAIVLLALGATITGGMIWFSAQREAILQRIRIFRADLETWA